MWRIFDVKEPLFCALSNKGKSLVLSDGQMTCCEMRVNWNQNNIAEVVLACQFLFVLC
jgi:hypothetical protein